MKIEFELIRPTDIDDYCERLAAAEWGAIHPGLSRDDHLSALAERKAAEREEAHRKMVAAVPVHLIPRSSVVYYIRFGDRIKIGTTTNIKNRLKQIPHDELLATEFGGEVVEKRRHEQFERYRLVGEWFTIGEGLAIHVNELRHRQYVTDRIPVKQRRYLTVNAE